MKQEPQSNIINYGLPANMYTKTEAFDQHLFLSKSEAPMHYGPHYHRQRSLLHQQTLEQVQSAKYFGITITDKFEWGQHVSEIYSKATKTFGVLRRNLALTSMHMKEAAY